MLTECDHCSLSLFEEDEQWLTLIAIDQPGMDAQQAMRESVAEVPASQDILAGRPHFVPDLRSDSAYALERFLYAAGYRSRASLPLRGRQQVHGMLNLTWRKRDGLNPAVLPVLEPIANALAMAVERSRFFAEVCAGRERLRALSQRLMEVQEEERRHLARELHDEIGQNLTGLKFAVDALAQAPQSCAADLLTEADTLIDGLVTRVRDLSLELRPAMLDDLGLLPALLWLFERYTAQTRIDIAFEHAGLEQQRFAPGIETAAYRIIQEALTNTARHAAVARARVRVWADAETLGIQVIDDGKGFQADRASTAGVTGGLAGMRERTALLGGQLTVDSAPGQGTRLNVQLPLRPERW